MRIVHISDTHNMHRLLTKLPEGDVIVHSGDFTMVGTEGEALDFMEWFCGLPYRHKVFIAGNHDFCLRGARLEGLDENCHYLCNSGVLIDGVKFYGVPMFFEDAAARRSEDFMNISPDTDVKITLKNCYRLVPEFKEELENGTEQVKEVLKFALQLEGCILNARLRHDHRTRQPDRLYSYLPLDGQGVRAICLDFAVRRPLHRGGRNAQDGLSRTQHLSIQEYLYP